jgi:plastocyanin
MPDPAPAIPAVTISIVGSFGSGAFAPNPLPAVVGSMVVWTNTDFRQHNIVLDDGTPVGNLAPGQSTEPMALTTMTTGYHCVLHPSMVGTISDPSAPAPPPPVSEPPPYEPPPRDPYDGYGRGSSVR